MGGYGSGQYIKWHTRTTLDEVQRLDVRYLQRQGMLSREGGSRMTWWHGNRLTGSIDIYPMPGSSLVLSYTITAYGGASRPVMERVELESTACAYGGTRPWFVCLGCQRRVAILALLNGVFRCRHCHGLAYASQSEDGLSRLSRKIGKLRQRLGADDRSHLYRIEKPKGMHWITCFRLTQEALVLEHRRAQLLEAWMVHAFGISPTALKARA